MMRNANYSEEGQFHLVSSGYAFCIAPDGKTITTKAAIVAIDRTINTTETGLIFFDSHRTTR